jgi:hypothetical protein
MPQVLVSVNFTAQPQIVSLQAGGSALAGGKLETLLKSPGVVDPKSLDQIVLAPFGITLANCSNCGRRRSSQRAPSLTRLQPQPFHRSSVKLISGLIYSSCLPYSIF